MKVKQFLENGIDRALDAVGVLVENWRILLALGLIWIVLGNLGWDQAVSSSIGRTGKFVIDSVGGWINVLLICAIFALVRNNGILTDILARVERVVRVAFRSVAYALAESWRMLLALGLIWTVLQNLGWDQIVVNSVGGWMNLLLIFLIFTLVLHNDILAHAGNLLVKFLGLPYVLFLAWGAVLPKFWAARPEMNFGEVWLAYVALYALATVLSQVLNPKQVL